MKGITIMSTTDTMGAAAGTTAVTTTITAAERTELRLSEDHR
jgi:hypothetical protein